MSHQEILENCLSTRIDYKDEQTFTRMEHLHSIEAYTPELYLSGEQFRQCIPDRGGFGGI